MYCFIHAHHSETYFPDLNPDKSKTIILLNVALAVCILSSIFNLCSCIVLVVLKPRSIIFIGQLIPPEYFYFPVALTVILYHAYIMIILFLSGITVAFGTIVCCFYIILVIKELCIGKRFYLSGNNLRSANNIVHAYRCLQVLHRNAMSLFGPYLAAFNGIMMMSAIYVNFVLLRYWEILEPLTMTALITFNLLIITVYSLVLQLGCMFCIGSIRMLRSWKRHKWSECKFECRVMKAFQRSCRPILLSWENYFVLGRLSLVIYGRGVVRGTFRALVLTQ